jgi:hypothetical protein
VCCGQNRTQLRTTKPTPPLTSNRPAAPQEARPVPAKFIYVGTTAMAVRGPVSGLNYRFDTPGAIIEVDLRDRKMLATLPQLRQVR